MNTSFGLLYVATGSSFVEEAAASARSAKKHMPDVPVAIATDDEALAKEQGIFDCVLLLDQSDRDYGIKIRGMQMSPFERTVFLDTDTRVLGSFYELYPLLDRFELCICHDPPRANESTLVCPASFPEPNTGVVAFRATRETERILERWRDVHAHKIEHLKGETLGNITDQGPLREVLWNELGDCRYWVLTPEYNLRCHCPWFASGEVKIIHGRGPCQDRTARLANRSAQMRVGDGKHPIARWWFKSKSRIKQLLPSSFYNLPPVTAEMHRSFSYQIGSLEEAERRSADGES